MNFEHSSILGEKQCTVDVCSSKQIGHSILHDRLKEMPVYDILKELVFDWKLHPFHPSQPCDGVVTIQMRTLCALLSIVPLILPQKAILTLESVNEVLK